MIEIFHIVYVNVVYLFMHLATEDGNGSIAIFILSTSFFSTDSSTPRWLARFFLRLNKPVSETDRLFFSLKYEMLLFTTTALNARCFARVSSSPRKLLDGSIMFEWSNLQHDKIGKQQIRVIIQVLYIKTDSFCIQNAYYFFILLIFYVKCVAHHNLTRFDLTVIQSKSDYRSKFCSQNKIMNHDRYVRQT